MQIILWLRIYCLTVSSVCLLFVSLSCLSLFSSFICSSEIRVLYSSPLLEKKEFHPCFDFVPPGHLNLNSPWGITFLLAPRMQYPLLCIPRTSGHPCSELSFYAALTLSLAPFVPPLPSFSSPPYHPLSLLLCNVSCTQSTPDRWSVCFLINRFNYL